MKTQQKQLNKKNTLSGGYTLIEVVITLTITSVAFISIYALFAKSMQADAESRYEIIGAALAQEGIEIIKNKREKNEMDWAMWNRDDDGEDPVSSFEDLTGLSDCNPELTWDPDYTFACGSDNDMQYNKNSSSKKYEAGCIGSDCVGPIFTRSCTMTEIDTDPLFNTDADSLRVVCEVKWKSLLLGGGERSAKTEIVLTDWQR
jgi:prepilin-type N-terminal cleavage/methylation domain-containing protein